MAIWKDIEKTVRGFVAAGIFDRDGMIVDGHSADPSFHIEHAAAAFITAIEEADNAGNLIGIGRQDEVQITYEGVVILLRRVPGSDRGLVLGLASRTDGSPLGRIRMTMDILMQRLTHSAEGHQRPSSTAPAQVS